MDTVEYKGFKINIVQDDCPENPITAWDGNHEFCCWHSRYSLGNSKRFGSGLGTVQECEAYARRTNSILLPLYMYEHGGIVLSLEPFACPWDSGQVGYVLIDRQWTKENYGKHYFTKSMRTRLLKSAQNNVVLYNDYLMGNVYGYNIEDIDDSCYGFYGDNYEESGLLDEAKSIIDHHIKNEG